MRNIVIGFGLTVLTGCAPIQQTANISTPIGESLRAGVGDEIIRAEGRESLPNVYGRADIFGRTRPTGFTVVQYGGLKDGKALLVRSGVITQSDATTMDRMGTATVVGGQNSVFAEFETNLRRERQLEGIAKAKAEGVYKGRPASIDVAQVRAMKARGLGATEIAKALSIHRASVYRLLEEEAKPA
jgi:hypothetical protein